MVLSWYRQSLAKRPFITQVVATAVLFGTGDVIAQQAVEKVGAKNHNYARTGRMVAYGGCVFGPGATMWYRVLPKIKVGGQATTIAARVLADQTLFASTNLAVFLSSMAYMEGANPKERLRDKYVNLLKKNWMVWPGVQIVNFTLVPLEHRVLVVNVVSLGWNCYLSYANSQGPATEKVAQS